MVDPAEVCHQPVARMLTNLFNRGSMYWKLARLDRDVRRVLIHQNRRQWGWQLGTSQPNRCQSNGQQWDPVRWGRRRPHVPAGGRGRRPLSRGSGQALTGAASPRTINAHREAGSRRSMG